MRDFIFSDERPHRRRRHLLFLGVLAAVFYLQSLVGPNMYKTALMSLLCFYPSCIISVYLCLDYFLPVFLQRKRYGRFALAFSLLVLVFLCVNYFAAMLFLELARDFPALHGYSWPRVGLSFVNTSHALVIGGLALGIKIAKNWYIQQKENHALARQRVITELRLEKARIYPRFLFQSLDKVHAGIASGSTTASQSLLKISDLLSYMLYDSNEKLIALEKEMIMIQHLVDIVKTNRTTHLNIRTAVTGDTHNIYIMPMIVFSLLENCLKELDNTKAGNPEFDLHIRVYGSVLNVRLALNGINNNGEDMSFWKNIVDMVRQKQEMLYPEGLRFEIHEEGQSLEVLLDIDIKTNIDEHNQELVAGIKHV